MKKLTFPLALVVAAALSASPALAQKGGHGHGNGHGRSGEVHGNRSHDRDDDDRDDDRYRGSDRYRTSNSTRLERRVPPGWCIGRGNPHNTVANCGPGQYRYDRRYDSRYNGGVEYDRYGNRVNTSGRYNTSDRYGTSGRYGNGTYGNNRDSYEAWKRDHDLRCRELSRQRPLDLRYQLQVRNQCAAETQEARRRYGV
jgi:hypothetical protein